MWVRGGGVSSEGAEADRYTETCHSSYLNPHPVPPRTIAARRIAPAMDPIMILVPLGPAQRKEEEGKEGGGKGRKYNTRTHTHARTHRQKINQSRYINVTERDQERQDDRKVTVD